MATDLSTLKKRLLQYDKMKVAQKKYNVKRWAEMKEARSMRELLEGQS